MDNSNSTCDSVNSHVCVSLIETKKIRKMGVNLARQFSVPANVIRILEFFISLIAFGLVIGWNSHGVTYRDLSKDDVNIIGDLNFFMAISVISCFATVVVGLIILLEIRSFTSLLDMIFSGTFALFWVLASVMMYVGLDSIAYSQPVKQSDITFTSLEAAAGLGFANAVYFGGSTWFAISAQRDSGAQSFGPARLSADLPSDILSVESEQRNKIFSPDATTF